MNNYGKKLFEVCEMMEKYLQELKDSGLTYIPKSKINDGEKVSSKSLDTNKILLSKLRDEMGDCSRCKLCQNRNNIVFGSGNPDADLIFVGEGPGEKEDKYGEPFIGRAGQLLTKMIQAMGMERDDVYICNVVKCRPPKNRDPEADEILACEPFLKRQLDIIKPKVIVGLGRYACHTLLQVDIAMSKLRGEFYTYQGIKFMPTFHPAYLLRNPSAKKLAWQDLQTVMSLLSNNN